MLQNPNSDSSTLKKDKKPISEALRAKRQKELRLKREAKKKANKKWTIEKLRNHPNMLIRSFFLLLNSIWIVAMAIGGFIAWLISFLFI